MQRPTVAIFSDPDPLTLSLIENLLSKFCLVKIFSSHVEVWQTFTAHLGNNLYLQVHNEKDFAEESDYAIFVRINDRHSEEFLENRLEKNFNREIKTFYIFSYSYLPVNSLKKFVSSNSCVIFVGNGFGPRMDLESEDAFSRVVKKIVEKKTINLNTSEFFYPVNISDAARLVVKWLFSFGPYGEEVALLSKPITGYEFYSFIQKLYPDVSFKITGKTKTIGVPRNIRTFNLKGNLSDQLSETINWFRKYHTNVANKPKNKPAVITRFRKALFLSAIILFLLFPYLFNLFSAFSFYVSKEMATKGEYSFSKSFLTAGVISGRLGYEASLLFTKIPVLEKLYEKNLYFSLVLVKIGSAGESAISLLDAGRNLFYMTLGDDAYDVKYYKNRMIVDIESLYRDLGFLQSELEVSRFLKDLNIEELRSELISTKDVIDSFPAILGDDKKVTYLVLLQNNMELRPTGGFIGSFGLLTFEKGRLVDLSIQDVYSADGQLKGHIEPPAPIAAYLGEANWYLRDSNWDPDFPASAQRAEWFLDKEIDVKTDGVVAIDLEFARELLKQLGPIYLADFNMEINSENLYEKTQGEVERKFFPGSQKKTNFLTALARSLVAKLEEPEEKNFVHVIKAILSSLEEKHIQVFLNVTAAQKGISTLGWGGDVIEPSCSNNCYNDWTSVIEANVGVNKANYFIKRESRLNVSLEAGTIRRELSLILENTANPVLGLSGRYKSYIRILAPLDVNPESVVVVSGQDRDNFIPETFDVHGRKEIGVLVEVPPGQKKEMVFRWSGQSGLNYSKSGEYRILVRKQAGTLSDPISVRIIPPSGLTTEGVKSYNSTLTRDFASRVFW